MKVLDRTDAKFLKFTHKSILISLIHYQTDIMILEVKILYKFSENCQQNARSL